jgi:hypothetical protein
MQTLVLAVMLFATSVIRIDTAKLAERGRDAWAAGSRTVTAEKIHDGGIVVTVTENDRVDTVSVRRQDGHLSIGHTDNGKSPSFLALDRPRVVVDGIDLEPFLTGDAGIPGRQAAPRPTPRDDESEYRYYVCPKDHSVLRVPSNAKRDSELKCPIDGTIMREGTGPRAEYWLLE